MITVEFYYYHKLTQKWMMDEKSFNSIESAIKFIKYVIPKHSDMVYSGFRCDDSDVTEEMMKRL